MAAHQRWSNGERGARGARLGPHWGASDVVATGQCIEEAAVEAIGGGGARARRGEEESRDGCGEDWVRASASYRGRREAEAPGIQWPASMSVLKMLVRQRCKGRRFKAELRRRLLGE
jgi:hypothetical protein